MTQQLNSVDSADVPLLSLVIPAFNAEEYLTRCLSTLPEIDQLQVIIVDDGSTDLTAAIARDAAIKTSNIQLFQQKNLGVAAARNAGAGIAQGKYIYFLDPDDQLIEGAVDQILSILSAEATQILAFNTINVRAGKPYPTDIYPSDRKLQSFSSGEEFIEKARIKNECWWYVCERDFLLKNSIFFPEGRYMEDLLFTTRVFLAADNVLFLQDHLHRYITRPGSVRTSKDAQHLRSMIDDMEVAVHDMSCLLRPSEQLCPGETSFRKLHVIKESIAFHSLFRLSFSTWPLGSRARSLLTNYRQWGAYPAHAIIKDDAYNLPMKLLIRILSTSDYALIAFLAALRTVDRMLGAVLRTKN